MKNPKLEIPGTWTRSGFTCRNPKSEATVRSARSVLECGGQQSATPLLLPAERPAQALPPLAGEDHCALSQSAVAAVALPAHSKTWRQMRILFCCFLLSALCLQAWGQYSIDWSTIDGGGGTSTGGVYSVSGTIGQPDAGTMSGGGYTLQGGIWGVIAVVQTPGTPLLSITLNHQLLTITVSWPLPAEGWVLEGTNALSQVSAPWPQIPPPYQSNGANLQFAEPALVGSKFYRLHKP